MIDYVKILLTGVEIDKLVNLLDFKIEVSEKTGEISTKRTAEYHFCKITIYDSGTVVFTGSIHKLWNSLSNVLAPNHKERKTYKGYNGNQFTLNNIIEVKNHLTALFNCEPQQMIFQNIEFGINTTPKFNPQLFLKGLLYHNGKSFEFRYKEHFAQAIHQRYYLKIYNKSSQYGMQEYTLRVELKIVKTEDIKHIGIKTFADINTSTLNKAKELLLKRFDEVVYYDNTITKDSLTERQIRTLERYSNPRYWIDSLTPKNRVYNKRILKSFVLNYSDNLQRILADDINLKFGIINRLSERCKFGIINRSSMGLKSTKKPHLKTCSITGVNLELEKDGSRYIKTTTLRHLKNNNEVQFESIVNDLLNNSTNKPKYERNIITHLAKQVRNRFYNQNKIKQIGYKQKLHKTSNQLQITF